jgi:cell division septum initiation protein DivIVA
MGQQDKIHVELPRTILGGLKEGPVDDLLQRIARDYANLERENQRLWETLERLGSAPVEPEPEERGEPEHHESSGFSGQAGAIAEDDERALVASASPAESHHALAPADLGGGEYADEVASAVLALARRAAREMRESTRAECELAIKKTRSRAGMLERDLNRARIAARVELEELNALRYEMREHMRSSLQALLRTFVEDPSGEIPALDWANGQGFVFSSVEQGKPHKSKKDKKSRS